MNNIVSFYHDKEPRVKTSLIWEKFGYKEHRTLKRVILNNKELFESKGKIITASSDAENKPGRPDESYLLNERQFILLVMLSKNMPATVEFKDRIEKEFFRMREKLASLTADKSQARIDGKEIYKQKTNVIKDFVEYATSQGSKNAKNYYSNLANMENKALFLLTQKFPNVRDLLDINQLMQVAVADQIIEKTLKKGMDDEMDYHDIYSLAKDKVIEFSNVVGKSQILMITSG